MTFSSPMLRAGAIVLVAMTTSGALAQNADAPGQDRVCLVTTGTANSWNDVDIVDTKWLPRKAAEQQAGKDPTKLRVFDYSNDPLVTNGTYASAEELCNEHFD